MPQNAWPGSIKCDVRPRAGADQRGEEEQVRVQVCVCVCCCEGAGVRPGLVAAVCKGHGHRGVCFV